MGRPSGPPERGSTGRRASWHAFLRIGESWLATQAVRGWQLESLLPTLPGLHGVPYTPFDATRVLDSDHRIRAATRLAPHALWCTAFASLAYPQFRAMWFHTGSEWLADRLADDPSARLRCAGGLCRGDLAPAIAWDREREPRYRDVLSEAFATEPGAGVRLAR